MERKAKWTNIKEIAIDTAVDIIAGILMAVSIQVFAVPAEFATSGLNGIALILHHLFGWKMGVVIMLINIPLALISLRYLGRRFLINSIKSIIITSVLLDVITPPLIPAYTGSPFLAAVFHAILAGIGLAMIFMRNSSTGGTDFIIMTINKLRPHMSVGAVVQVIDGAIILIGAFFFRNIDAVLYGVISVIIMGIVMDRMMAGAKTGKVAFIVSEKPEEIAKAIDEEVDRGSTYLRGIGSYTGVERNIVFCACASKELYKVKKTVESIDPKAFLVITDSREVYGEGFNPIVE